MKIVVTAGATREPIDAVRFISNVSTGATGAKLAELLSQRGHEVTLLRGESAVAAADILEQESFGSAADLSSRLQRRLATGAYDAVIMTAAVSDYRPEVISSGKMDSDAADVSLRLVRNEKILLQLKSFAPRPLRVIGFKLTVSADLNARRAAVEKQFTAGGVDAIVHNDLTEIRATSGSGHPFTFFTAPRSQPKNLAGAPALAAELDAWLTHAAVREIRA